MIRSKAIVVCILIIVSSHLIFSQQLLVPDRVFDGIEMHEGWVVVVDGNQITYAGPLSGKYNITPDQTIEMKGYTLMPGMVEGHAHMYLYPYDQTSWNDQVIKEQVSYRTAKATMNARQSLMAGFTTVRDLGTEGAGYADVGLKKAIRDGVIPGPRLLISTKAIVATGSYGPKGFADHVNVPLGAEEADADNIVRVVRNQIGKGADFIKVYADYRWGPGGEAMPTFSIEELQLMVATAESSGRYVVAHASTAEGMRRAILAGVETIEHGDNGNSEIWKLMKEYNVAFCPTLAAGDAVLQYNGWDKQTQPDPPRIVNKKKTFAAALKNGVRIVAGGDVGVFEHGDNVRELIMMHDYGMDNIEVLKSVTSGNAHTLHLNNLGQLKTGFIADIIAVKGDPLSDLRNLYQVGLVMKDGKIYKNDL